MSKELEVLNEIEKRLSDVPYQEEIQIIKQALEKLHQIENVEGSEVMEAFERILRTHRKIYGEWTPNIEEILEWEGLECKEIDIIKTYIQQQTQRERKYEELKSKVRELYTKPERKNGKLENSFDYFIRAEETKNRVIKELKQLVGEDDE